MTKLRLHLLVILLMGVVAIIAAGSLAAQEDTDDPVVPIETPVPEDTPELEETPEPGILGFDAELLRNGVWLKWTRGAERLSHYRITVYGGTSIHPEEENIVIQQDEKAHASYGFIPYSELDLSLSYSFQLHGMKSKRVIVSSVVLVIALPADETAALAYRSKPRDRETTHPSGLSYSRNGADITFQWTPGIDSRYQSHQIFCRVVGAKGWPASTTIQPNLSAVNEVTRVTYNTNVDGVLESGNRYICRVMMVREDGRRGPMANRVIINYR